jgi:expansin (peptidoglycan-binding protein)
MLGPSNDLMVAAVSHTDFEASKACGAYVSVRGPSGTTITVRVTDQCPECAVGQLNLSAQAFAKLAPASAGQISITWKLLSPSMSAPMSVRYASGSSQYWCGIEVINHRNPVARLEVRSGSSWSQLSRSDYNYFLSPDGSGCGGSIRITDIYGQRLTANGIALTPDTVQSAGVQFTKR